MRRAPLVFVLCGCAAGEAFGFDDPQFKVDLEGGYAAFADTRRYHGVVGGLETAYQFDDAFGVRAGYALGEHRSKGLAFRVQQVSIGARYQLDVFHYVPWASASPTLYLPAGEGGPPDASLGYAVGFGFDALLSDAWSLGFATHLHQIFGVDRFPAYMTLGLRFGWRFTLGDPLAP